jgi:hypothetical protein
MLCPSIEPDLPAQRNIEFAYPYQTDERKTRFGSLHFTPVLAAG